jgi:hypothetical protein
MGGVVRCSQSFRAEAAILDSVSFYLWREAGVSGNVYAKLYTHTGTYGTSSTVLDSLAVSDAIAATAITIWPTKGWVTFYFTGTNKYQFSDTSKFCIQLSSIDVGAGTYSAGSNSGASPNVLCHSGNLAYYTGSWTTYQELDMLHFIYGSTIPTATNRGQVIIFSR